ncbi:hypothetical protein BCR32DRAFT_264375 [Anaeromyces robustus]|uniref:Uncharacterized protein n=1 Tax=Anaeromyces robustus TaxID=1754192 RepID=A0A1Y1XNI6_9FUNG|nr:hypothetical protein BCR32DRAFT_264375 [Anaeromyces robustus]|eukprot:ORX87309.1 hypothetical protein BCR32DRAFT_264375 [Anaeromyces robustus]
MSFAPQGVSPFLPGNNYLKLNHGVKKEVDRSQILRKRNNKVNFRKCSDKELLELLEKNEKLLMDKTLLDKLPDKGEKVRLKNKEIKEEIANRNIIIDKDKDKNKDKENVTETNNNNNNNNNKSKDTTEIDNDIHAMEVESINQKLQTINISEGNENDIEDDKEKENKPKRGQARVIEMIMNTPSLNKPNYMIRHKPNKNHIEILSIEESIEIQNHQRKIQKEHEILEAKKKLERTIMSTGPVHYHSNEYRNNNEFDDDDDDDDDDEDNDNRSYYDSSDEEADAFLFGPHK